MTIAGQIAQELLNGIKKVCAENEIDIGTLKTKIIYDTEMRARIEAVDTKGISVAGLDYNLDIKYLDIKRKKRDLENYCIDRICSRCKFKNENICIVNKIRSEEATDKEVEEAYRKMRDDESKQDFSDMTDEETEDYVSDIKGKNTDKESQNECEFEEKKMEQVKVLKEVTRMIYPNRMEEVIPIKEFVKNITDKGYKVMIRRENVIGGKYDVVIYEEEELKE
jgi:hypothetical protein